MTTQTTEQKAQKQVEMKVEFQIHLRVYLAVNALLVIINLATTPGTLWFLGPLMGWGIGVIMHRLNVSFSDGSTMKERMVAKEMKKTGLMIAMMILAASMYAQEGQKGAIYSQYGGPMVFGTQINNQMATAIGGKGGAVFADNFAFGGLGFGTINAPAINGDNLMDNTNALLNMTYGAGGVFFEYIIPVNSRIQVTIPVNFMAGGIKLYENDIENVVETTGFFILEPGITFDFNVSRAFTPSVFMSYRQAVGSSLENFGDDKISGLNAGFVFKFGN